MSLIEAVERLLSTRLSILRSIFRLARLEIKVAQLSIYPLLTWIVLSAPVLFAFWITVLLGIGYTIQLFSNNVWFTLLTLAFIQLTALIIVLYSIIKNLNHLKFKRTRRYLTSHPLKVHNEQTKDAPQSN